MATDFRYIDGIYALRSPDFFVVNENGKRSRSPNERMVMARLLEAALVVRETTRVTFFKQIDQDHADCDVLDTFVIVPKAARDAKEKEKTKAQVLETTQADSWIRLHGHWRKRQSRILHHQSSQREVTPADLAPPEP